MNALRVGTWIVTTTLVGGTAAARAELPGQIAVGARVVAAPDGAWLRFYVGSVAALERSRVVVERVDPFGRRTSSAVDRARVWRADAPPRPPAREGEAMICLRSYYAATDLPGACLVVRVEGNATYCEDVLGGPFRCDEHGLVRPDAAMQAAIRRNVERQTRFRSFRAAALAAGKPIRPEGWEPKPRAKILILDASGDWTPGIVKSVRKGEIVVRETVEWDVTLPLDQEIVPVPTRARSAEVGQYVLTQWSPGQWVFGRVVATRSELFEVADGYDERKLLSGMEIIPIGRR